MDISWGPDVSLVAVADPPGGLAPHFFDDVYTFYYTILQHCDCPWDE